MEETRRFNIEKKIFKKSDIKNIGKVFLEEYKNAQEKEHNSSITFRLDCIDNTSYESENIGLLDDGNIIDIKRTRTIEITYHNYELRRYMNISLIHGNSYENTLIVRGQDQNWVNGIFTKIKEIIDSIQPQDNWILKHKTLLLHLNALGIGIIFFAIFNLLILQYIEPIENPSGNVLQLRTFFETYPLFIYLVGGFLKWMVGMSWAPEIRSWVLSLWPLIEFDFGPDHLKIEKMRRLRMSIFLSTAIIPLSVSIVSNIINKLL